ncbi:MAG: DUF4397 domain-containing protein [Bacteroidetes bacterium]|nr:DUF4397 domain-containing protein [Bacteroidota bacterium]
MKHLFKSILICAGISASAGLAAQTANLQVIHNCADPAAASVDVYVNGTLALDNFAFRSATGFLSLPAGVALNVGVAPATSMSAADTLKNFTLGPLQADSSYIVVASGVVATGFAANPNGKSTAFDLKVIDHAKTASGAGTVSFAVFHGVTDAPGVDVNLSTGGNLVSNAQYGDASGYLTVPPTWYPIDIAPAGVSTPLVQYVADLSGLGGKSALVIASGFLTPSSNNNGPSFAILAVLADGTVVTLPQQQQSYVQVIHNSPDPAADSVDVYVDGTKAISNFKFRTATPYIQLLSNVNHTVAVAPANSTNVSQAIATFPNIMLDPDSSYVVTASGVVGTGFAANPDGRSTAFTLLIKPNARRQASSSGEFDFFVIHGAPDAPSVDVSVEVPSILAVNNASYTDQTGYLPVPVGSYVFDLQDSAGSTTLKRYLADLSSLGGQSGVALASGFLNPANNNNGPSFGIWVALASGGNLIPLSDVTGIKDITNEIGLSLYPNPTSSKINISLKGQANTVEVMNLTGAVVKTINANGAENITINTSDLSAGIYTMHITTRNGVANAKFTVMN